MPSPLTEPGRRVTLNLFEADCALLERRYGWGWTEQVRLLVRQNCRDYLRGKSELDAIMERNDE